MTDPKSHSNMNSADKIRAVDLASLRDDDEITLSEVVQMTRDTMDLTKYENDETVLLVRGGRTGQKLHKAWRGSSCLLCGIWIRHDVSHFIYRGDYANVPIKHLCEKCFPPIVYTSVDDMTNDKSFFIGDMVKVDGANYSDDMILADAIHDAIITGVVGNMYRVLLEDGTAVVAVVDPSDLQLVIPDFWTVTRELADMIRDHMIKTRKGTINPDTEIAGRFKYGGHGKFPFDSETYKCRQCGRHFKTGDPSIRFTFMDADRIGWIHADACDPVAVGDRVRIHDDAPVDDIYKGKTGTIAFIEHDPTEPGPLYMIDIDDRGQSGLYDNTVFIRIS